MNEYKLDFLGKRHANECAQWRVTGAAAGYYMLAACYDDFHILSIKPSFLGKKVFI